MDKDLIVQQEAANDGQTIYLYYDDMVGMYVAYGLSAYYADMVTDPIISFSQAIDKPAALLGKPQVLSLRQGLTKEEASSLIETIDTRRENYIKRYANTSRYDARNYDIVLCSDGHTEEELAALILSYIG